MLTTQQYLDRTDNADRRWYSCDIIKTLQRNFKSYCRGDYSWTRHGRAITCYASLVAFNKVYSTDVNKCVHCVRAGQFKTHHDIQGTTVNCVGGEPRLACCVCDNYQQAINTGRSALSAAANSSVCMWPHRQSVLW